MNTQKLQILEKELALKRREQNLSMAKFVLGALLLGGLSFALDLKSLIYVQGKDDRTFLSSHLSLLREDNLQKRLSNIAFLEAINGRKSEFLSALKEQTQAEIDEAEKQKERLKKIAEREKAEREKAAEEEIRRAKEAERQAEEAAAEAKRRAEASRLEAQKAYDRALQEVYPYAKRRGDLIP